MVPVRGTGVQPGAIAEDAPDPESAGGVGAGDDRATRPGRRSTPRSLPTPGSRRGMRTVPVRVSRTSSAGPGSSAKAPTGAGPHERASETNGRARRRAVIGVSSGHRARNASGRPTRRERPESRLPLALGRFRASGRAPRSAGTIVAGSSGQPTSGVIVDARPRNDPGPKRPPGDRTVTRNPGMPVVYRIRLGRADHGRGVGSTVRGSQTARTVSSPAATTKSS